MESVIQRLSLIDSINSQLGSSGSFNEIFSKDLRLSYNPTFLSAGLSDDILQYCENNIQYYDAEMTKVFIYGEWRKIPRRQIAFGDKGLAYKFSGISLPAADWDPVIESLKNRVCKAAECDFNFVLVNRYADGNDYIGEHRDDERDLDRGAPIASVSLGQSRDFIFRHEDQRRGIARAPENVRLVLENGSLLLIRQPTNRHWYHSIPKCRTAAGVRVNFTFRKFVR